MYTISLRQRLTNGKYHWQIKGRIMAKGGSLACCDYEAKQRGITTEQYILNIAKDWNDYFKCCGVRVTKDGKIIFEKTEEEE